MNVCSVIVTYSDRYHLLAKVINSCFKEGVDNVIVVDNASIENSKKQLQVLEKKLKKLKVVYLDKNTGSAEGFRVGLKEAYNCDECDFIWLLDDDNVPQKDSLKALKEFWSSLKENDKEKKISLLSSRPQRTAFKEAIMTNNPDLVLGRKNSFLGFHILELPQKILRVVKRKLKINTFIENTKIKHGKVSVAPYGGMFFNKNLIDSIGYPRAEFYLYADDHEWSYRIIKKGGSIYYLTESLVLDIDDNLNGEISTNIFDSFMNKNSNFKVYYGVRNRIIFEKEALFNNRIVYMINKTIFMLILQLFRNKSNVKRYLVIKQAINDASNKYFRNVYADEF